MPPKIVAVAIGWVTGARATRWSRSVASGKSSAQALSASFSDAAADTTSFGLAPSPPPDTALPSEAEALQESIFRLG